VFSFIFEKTETEMSSLTGLLLPQQIIPGHKTFEQSNQIKSKIDI
jgi:hypothetical protein